MLPVDQMIEAALQHLLSGHGEARGLAHLLATRWPDQPVLEVIFAMTCAASTIETELASPRDREIAIETWRMAALLAVDLYGMRHRDLPAVTAADLLAYWQQHDGFFLPG
ncbi:hypothetical protein [Rhodobacter ferrooxidans]|uniref:hypothetical protein n=1 Tax=Rhodobacter ferrooxidans TaxID=371731 RepID=UPI0018DDA43E|nr:hypothetical protein [Rhodobacter sp. SW2]